MPLSDPAPRTLRHTRTVTCRGYEREDGLWDIEAHLVDQKAYPFENGWRGTIEPGDPIHEMWMRLTMDDSLTIKAVEAVTDKSPFAICPGATPAYQKLVGTQIRPGFTGLVREMFGGTQGCTHLRELLAPMATAAMQTILSLISKRSGVDFDPSGQKPPDGKRPPALLNSCHAFASDGPVVKQAWPDHYTGPDKIAVGTA